MNGETADQTDARLLAVIANSEFHVLPGV